jgi:hypothetical protein
VPLPRDLLLGNGNRSRFETFNRRRNVSIELFRENVIDNYWDWNEMKSDKEIDCHLVWGLQIIFDIPAHAQPHVIFPLLSIHCSSVPWTCRVFGLSINCSLLSKLQNIHKQTTHGY